MIVLPLNLQTPPRELTFGIQLGPVTLKAFEPHHISQQGEELHEGCSCLLVVVHLFFRALASPAVQDAHFALEAQLRGSGQQKTKASIFCQLHPCHVEENSNNWPGGWAALVGTLSHLCVFAYHTCPSCAQEGKGGHS